MAGSARDEFSVSIVGDHAGRPQVMLAFGHLRWMFQPALAADLATVLTDAAAQAAAMPPGQSRGNTSSADAPLLAEGSQ